MGLGGHAPLPIRLGGTALNGLTAEQHARLCADMVAFVRSAKLAKATVEQTGAVTGNVLAYNGQNGIGLAHAPVPTFDATGDFILTFPNRWEDDYGNSYAVKIRRCRVSCGDSAARYVTWTLNAPNVVRIRTFNAAGAAVITKTTVTVY